MHLLSNIKNKNINKLKDDPNYLITINKNDTDKAKKDIDSLTTYVFGHIIKDKTLITNDIKENLKKTIYNREKFAYEGDTIGSSKHNLTIKELVGGKSDHKFVKVSTIRDLPEPEPETETEPAAPEKEEEVEKKGGKRRTRRRRRRSTRRKRRMSRRRRRSTRRKR